MSAPEPTPAGTSGAAVPGADEVRIYPSRFKHFLLALPCAYLAILGAQAIRGGAGSEGVGWALLAFGLIAAAVLMLSGFSRQPVLVLDAEGIFCRRPDVGLIPWRAITGLGIGRGLFSRVVLIVAYDEAALSDDARARLGRERTSALTKARAARFQGDIAGRPSVQIPLSMLAVRPARLQRLLEREVRYHGEPE